MAVQLPRGVRRINAPDGKNFPPISYATSERLIRKFRKHVAEVTKQVRASNGSSKPKRSKKKSL